MFFFIVMNFFASLIKGKAYFYLALGHIGYQDHLDNLLNGVVRVSDLVYFFAFIAFFLALTVSSVENKRWS